MLTMPKEQSLDILVTGEQGQPLLVVEIKRRAIDQNIRQQIARYSKSVGAEFLMGIDPQNILVAKTLSGLPDWSGVVKLSTPTILSHYGDVQNLERVEGFYLQGLIEAWLRDFSFSWKSQRPPGYEELSRIGLASRLRNSETHTR
jgi:hypothetical protein